MKKTLTIIGIAAASLAGANAQILYSTWNGTVTLNFNNLNTNFGGAYDSTGGSSTFPTTDPASTTIYSGSTNPALVTSFNDYGPGGVYSNTGTYSNSNSMRALRDGSSSDLALGLKDSNNRSITLRLKNTTGAALNSWSIGYNVEQYSKGSSATTMGLSYSLNGTSFITTNMSGGAIVTANNTAPVDVNLASVLSTARTATVSQSIANNAEIYFRWTYAHVSGTSVHMGIDDIVVSAVPEPTTWALIGLGSAFMIWNLRRKRSVRA
jgi:hypothetical protein